MAKRGAPEVFTFGAFFFKREWRYSLEKEQSKKRFYRRMRFTGCYTVYYFYADTHL